MKSIKNHMLASGETQAKKHHGKAKSKVHHKKSMKNLTEKSPKAKKFIEKRMHEMKEGHMHSRVKEIGPVVSNPKQGIAIALSELRAKGAKIPKKKK